MEHVVASDVETDTGRWRRVTAEMEPEPPECGADHEVLERMDFLVRGDFEQEEGREDEDKKEDAVFDRAFDIAVGI